jgi:hypothetical protein
VSEGVKTRKLHLRPWVRAMHRDVGYVAVGLTIVYALSGLAVNHIADWNPNFHDTIRELEIGAIQGDTEAVAASAVLQRMGISERPSDTYRAGDELTILLDHRTLHVTSGGHVLDEAQKPRFILRAVNWLHLNRGKKAWTYFADAYAAGLLVLALSGMFMIPGRKGLVGRGAALVAIGVAIPVAYVVLSNGP